MKPFPAGRSCWLCLSPGLPLAPKTKQVWLAQAYALSVWDGTDALVWWYLDNYNPFLALYASSCGLLTLLALNLILFFRALSTLLTYLTGLINIIGCECNCVLLFRKPCRSGA